MKTRVKGHLIKTFCVLQVAILFVLHLSLFPAVSFSELVHRSIAAARMYRSLCRHGSITDRVYVHEVPLLILDLFSSDISLP
jgi:hypothetical protein